ncbi:MAG: hypothetical protein AABX96_00830, partial [Nanoarchaeota archaeon]
MHIKYAKEVVAILILVVAVLALYYTFVPVSCSDYSCFEAHMTKCKPAVYINEEEEASWKYEVLGTADKKCQIEVTLLNAKEGNVDLRQYEKTNMICAYAIGVAGYPEKNLVACHGTLKEGLQAVVIEKLYKYIVVNLGEIREELIY